ncbi:hypothetical protein C8K61_102462 [Pseudomonas sp. GV071]|nr:hypothetical protein C8K61_102462 [Pseudomonas sp. GV071]
MEGVERQGAAKGVKGHGWPVSPAPGTTTVRGDLERSARPRLGQALLVTFVATDKSDSRVRRETKREVDALKQKYIEQILYGCCSSLPRWLGILFRALRASFFWQSPQKKPKSLAPTLGLRCAATSLAPSLLQGPARRAIHGPSRLSRLPAARPLTQRLHSACAHGAGRSQARSRSRAEPRLAEKQRRL